MCKDRSILDPCEHKNLDVRNRDAIEKVLHTNWGLHYLGDSRWEIHQIVGFNGERSRKANVLDAHNIEWVILALKANRVEGLHSLRMACEKVKEVLDNSNIPDSLINSRYYNLIDAGLLIRGPGFAQVMSNPGECYLTPKGWQILIRRSSKWFSFRGGSPIGLRELLETIGADQDTECEVA